MDVRLNTMNLTLYKYQQNKTYVMIESSRGFEEGFAMINWNMRLVENYSNSTYVQNNQISVDP